MTDKFGQGHQRYRIATFAASPGPAPGPSRGVRRYMDVAAWLYAAILLGTWGAVRWSPAEFWPTHLFLYGPSWVLFLPALALTPLAAWLQSRRSIPALVLAAFPLIGICGCNIPWSGPLPDGDPSRSTLRLLTCNVQGSDLRAEDLAALVRSSRPDILLLQESRPGDARSVVGHEGWFFRSAGEFCLASRYPVVEFEALRRPDKEYRIVAVRAKVLWSGRAIPVVGVHLMTPRKGLEAIIHSPLRGLGAFRDVAEVQRFESDLLRRWVEDARGPLILAGDFNLTAEHALFRRDWSGFADAFGRTGWGLGHTMFTRRIGLRIDHVLCGPSWRPTLCSIGPEVGSAHRPVVADLAWRGQATER